MQVGAYYIDTRTELGSGTQGMVFQAIHIPTRTKLAAKITVLDEERKCLEFDKAVMASRRLNHRHILKSLAQFEKNSMGIVLMEKMAMDLLDYIQEHEDGKLSLDESRVVFRQIAEAVAHCHDNNIAHMDIKPENILVSSQGEILLADFGCCHDFRHDVYSTGRFGTIYYCAPEVKQSSPYKPHMADVWSLGILLHVLLTGHWPFQGDTIEMVNRNAQVGNIMIHEQSLSVESLLFLQYILRPEPDTRPTMALILGHSWFTPAEKGRDGYLSEDGEGVPESTVTHTSHTTRTTSCTESTVISYYTTETTGSIYTATRTGSWSSEGYSGSDSEDDYVSGSYRSSSTRTYYSSGDEDDDFSSSFVESVKRESSMESDGMKAPRYISPVTSPMHSPREVESVVMISGTSGEGKKKSKLKDTMTKSLQSMQKKMKRKG